MSKIGAAVIGLGGMGQHDVETLQQGAGESVTKVTGYDVAAGACAKARERFGIRTYDTIDEVWRDPGVQLVYICTSNASHVPLAVAALAAGKAVMCEKPFGRDEQELAALRDAVRRTGGWFHPGFECRHYSRLYREIKGIIDSGEIGTLVHMNHTYVLQPWSNAGAWRQSLAETGGLFPEKLCHYVDLPRWWDGTPIVRFFAAKSPNIIPGFELIDNVELTYEFESGCLAHLAFMMGPAFESRMAVDPELARKMRRTDEFFICGYVFVGTEGGITADLWAREMRVFHHAGKPGLGRPSAMVRMRTWEEADDFVEFHNTWEQNIDVARRVACGEPPAVTINEAAESMRFCFACEQALKEPWQVREWDSR